MHESLAVVDPPDQTQLASIEVQLEFHPSPLFVFPSSHFSDPAFNPSPHLGTQDVGLLASFWYSPAEHWEHESVTVGDPLLQIHPSSTDEQSALHPSPAAVFPSSHFSDPALNPSPHLVTHSVGLVDEFCSYPSGHWEHTSAEV